MSKKNRKIMFSSVSRKGCPLKIGDTVVCISDKGVDSVHNNRLAQGSIYEISKVDFSFDSNKWFVYIDSAGHDGGYFPSRFKKLKFKK